LIDDVDLTSIEMNNEQVVTINRFEVSTLWLFCWSFEHVEKQKSLDFKENAIKLSIETDQGSVQTSIDELSKGNICLLGRIHQSTSGVLSFTNESRCITVEKLKEIEELYDLV
jgi:hypothetical protein